MSEVLKAPFPWFGGKSRVASLVWERFGNVPNYIEPFFGSGAVLLGRPHTPSLETINDKDGFVANFWRAVHKSPEAVADFSDNPVFENDLHARHAWLVERKEELQARLEGDPDYFDPKIAGWWCWGICCWIGGEFCSGKGPWHVADGKLVNDGAGEGIERRRIHTTHQGLGVRKRMVSHGDSGRGIVRQILVLNDRDQGIKRKRARLTGWAEAGVNAQSGLNEWFESLAARLRRVRVCCGDWSRITGPSVTFKNGLTGVFLDPPYSEDAGRDMGLYRNECGSVAHAARAWAIDQGTNPMMRIALCGYEGEHAMPDDWACLSWKANGGYGARNSENKNPARERIWFSPHCLQPRQEDLL